MADHTLNALKTSIKHQTKLDYFEIWECSINEIIFDKLNDFAALYQSRRGVVP